MERSSENQKIRFSDDLSAQSQVGYCLLPCLAELSFCAFAGNICYYYSSPCLNIINRVQLFIDNCRLNKSKTGMSFYRWLRCEFICCCLICSFSSYCFCISVFPVQEFLEDIDEPGDFLKNSSILGKNGMKKQMALQKKLAIKQTKYRQ